MNVGDNIPSFSLPDQDWNTLQSDELIGKPCVIYFYPKDDTPGCTRQACSFRDQFETFRDMGAEVVGVSSDTPEEHRKFQEKYRLPYRLLSDSKGELRKKFKVPTAFFGLIPGRVTYVFDREGKLIDQFNSQSRAERHITKAIQLLEEANI